MLDVSNAFTAEERDTVRKIAHNLQVSWKKESILGNRTFTIGVSLIGGNDVIGINPGAIGSPGNYRYFDESEYVNSLGWERGLNFPTGGLSKAYAEAELDNTSRRFLPDFMGGNSELFTSIIPSRPTIISAGFEANGIDETIPQFAGLITRQPSVDVRYGEMNLTMEDYISFFENKYLDQEVMFTAQRTDEVIQTMFEKLGMSTAQYRLDTGINTIPFGLFESGTRFSDIIHQLVEAENGQLYQDEEGIIRFENRQHWFSSPHSDVQRVIHTAQVINAVAPNEDHLINNVEIRSEVRQKIPESVIFKSAFSDALTVEANSRQDIWVEFTDPTLSITIPTGSSVSSYFKANSAEDGSGSDLTSSLSITKASVFANSAKLEFTNSGGTDAYLTDIVITGRQAKKVKDIYYREKDGASSTAYQEHTLSIDNRFIQNETWAESYAQLILDQYSDVENIQVLTIRAIPELQMGDLISWQGRYWRLYKIRSKLSVNEGFIQELTLLKRDIQQYFTIGISTIGGTDQIAA